MAEELGLRERKKLQTERRVWRTAVELFLERGFEKVSVQEIAAAAEVSKMTVFNYYGSKEDLVLKPMEHHAEDAARAVHSRAPGSPRWRPSAGSSSSCWSRGTPPWACATSRRCSASAA
ncbi:TetR/AcrR family transcriptional regulator [Streptomyces sp. Ac-502]|uniref:TetR/AcrR family transcriptional regulator n=1 Tax=Streptomyces sp. Ac-502 TaxID=3342801 RepID=UPI00386284AC